MRIIRGYSSVLGDAPSAAFAAMNRSAAAPRPTANASATLRESSEVPDGPRSIRRTNRGVVKRRRSHRPVEIVAGQERPLSWWRTWHDRDEASLPRLVRESEEDTRQRVVDDHLHSLRGRLAAIYAAEHDLRRRDDIPSPPRGRPRRPTDRPMGSVRGKVVADFPDLLAEWDWDVNGDLDPPTVAAGGRQRIVWRCCLNPDHVWETRLADRTTKPSLCPYDMGNRVRPSESLAAHFPWLAVEWHPTRNELRPDQVTRASGREIIWRCEHGHEWMAVIYARTLSKSGCPTCYADEAAERSKAGRLRARQIRDELAAVQVATLLPPDPDHAL